MSESGNKAAPEVEKKAITDAILNSSSRKKIVVGGPGTGKTRLFQQLCAENKSAGKNKNLTMTFINELVNDLSIELRELSEVRTFHSFALGHVGGNAEMFLGLTSIIENDYKIIEDKDVNFGEAFHNLSGQQADLDFYSKRRQYYDYYGPDCSLFALLKLFEKDEKKIPRYSQIMIDEFQDFNKLECAIIDKLSDHNPILIAGDDDQALYHFKHADADEIRRRYSSTEYESFELPFCSRCTEVVIKAFNSVVESAKSKGFLSKRIDKAYRYFPSLDKDSVCVENPKIIVKTAAQSNRQASLIDSEIQKLIKPGDKCPKTILVICPLPQQVKRIARMLKELGYTNIQTSLTSLPDILVGAFDLLLQTGKSKSNLGWRIVAECIMTKEGNGAGFAELLRNNQRALIANGPSKTEPFWKFVDKELRERIKHIIAILRKVRSQKAITEEERDCVFQLLEIDPIAAGMKELKRTLDIPMKKKNLYKNTPIKITNILKSKGLTYDYSFLVDFDDRFLLDNGKSISDDSICKFLVALTRARNRTYIYTGISDLPTYVKWMPSDCLEVSALPSGKKKSSKAKRKT